MGDFKKGLTLRTVIAGVVIIITLVGTHMVADWISNQPFGGF